MDPVIFVKEGRITRKFKCPFCGYVKNFFGKEAKRYRKRVAGFTCPGCGKKPTEADYNKKKGRGPKPKEERRKRVKKDVVKEIPKAIVQPFVEQFEWRTSEPASPRGHQNRRYGTNGRREWRPKLPQPTDRTLGEAVMSSLNIRPSAPIPHQSLRSEEKLENNEIGKDYMEKLEKHEKKLALMIVRLDRVEARLVERITDLDEKLKDLDNKLQALSALTSHMENILGESSRKLPRIQQRTY